MATSFPSLQQARAGTWSRGDSRDPHLGPSRGAGGLCWRAAEEFLGSPSWAFWRRVCPTVSLLLAGRREASGGPLLQAHFQSRSCSQPAPQWAEMHQGKLEHPGGPGCGKRHRCGTLTCRPVPQGQPHHVAAQPVGEAVDPLVIEPVACCLLQLAAGQGGGGGQSGGQGQRGGCSLHPNTTLGAATSQGEHRHSGHVRRVAGQR